MTTVQVPLLNNREIGWLQASLGAFLTFHPVKQFPRGELTPEQLAQLTPDQLLTLGAWNGTTSALGLTFEQSAAIVTAARAEGIETVTLERLIFIAREWFEG